jgi:hypothetical protein
MQLLCHIGHWGQFKDIDTIGGIRKMVHEQKLCNIWASKTLNDVFSLQSSFLTPKILLSLEGAVYWI